MLLLILAALIVAGGSGYYVLDALRAPEPQAGAVDVIVERPKTTDVYSAAAAIAPGAIIAPESLGRLPIEDAALTPEMVVADAAGAELLAGSVARQVLPAGVPIARSAVVQPGERGFLAAVLPPGKRAVSIPIGEVAGLSGLVLPGDRVDIILTYSVSGDAIAAGRDVRASETVMRNIRVLALDQRLGQVAPGEELPPVARTATLEVTPREAEVITLATTLGDLSLVLNALRDGGEPAASQTLAEAALERVAMPRAFGGDSGGRAEPIEPRAMTLDSDVTSLLQRTRTEAAAVAVRNARVQVVRGRASQAVEFGARGAEAEAAPVMN
jgi:pilus assembly protein CpaB